MNNDKYVAIKLFLEMRIMGDNKETLVPSNQENFTVGLVKAPCLGERTFLNEALILISERNSLVHIST